MRGISVWQMPENGFSDIHNRYNIPVMASKTGLSICGDLEE